MIWRVFCVNGIRVKALVRSKDKVQRQFKDLNPGCVEMIEGDMTQVAGFARALKDCEVLFHTTPIFATATKVASTGSASTPLT